MQGPMRRPLALLATLAVAAALLLGVGGSSPAVAAPGGWLTRINDYRAQNGLAPLREDPATSVVAQTWTQTMAATNTLAHNPLLAQQVTTPWTRLGENVGYGGDEASLFQAFVNSSGHRANLLGNFNGVGIGEVWSGSRLWTTHVFLLTSAVLPPPPPPPCPSGSSTGTSPGAPTATPAGQPTYQPLTPARLMDTRPGATTVDGLASGTGALAPCTTRTLQVTGRGGVPAWGVGSVVLNLTATAPNYAGYLSAYPAGTARPQASNVNFTAGQTVANSVIAKVGAGGQVTIYNDQGSTHVIADVAGWFPTVSDYNTLSPARLLDTRGGPTVDGSASGGGAIGSGSTRSLDVTGRGGVPASGVGAVILNVTATGPSTGGFLTVFPSGTSRPGTSNLNFTAGQTIANLVVATVGGDGQVSIFNAAGTTHVIADVAGWFPVGSDYRTVSPARLMDTRPTGTTIDGIFGATGALLSGTTRTLTVTGRAGVPSSGVGAVVLNLTVTGPTAGGFLTVFPTGAARPNTSNVNFGPGQTVANAVIAKVGTGGQVSIYNALGSTQVIADVAGWLPA